MKKASFSFMVYDEDTSTPLSTKQGLVVETESGEQIYVPVVNLHTEDLEKIRTQAHSLVDNTVDAALKCAFEDLRQ